MYEHIIGINAFISIWQKPLSLHYETLSLKKIRECKWAMGDYLLQM